MNEREAVRRRDSSPRRLAVSRAVLLLALIALCGQLCACADSSKYVMHVDASAQPVSYGKRYVILPGIMNVTSGDPGFQAVAAQLDGMLAAKGYTKAANIEQADLGLYLVYGVKERRGEGFRVGAGVSLEGGQAGVSQAGTALSVETAKQGGFTPFTHSGVFISPISPAGPPGSPSAGLQALPQAGGDIAQMRFPGPIQRAPVFEERMFVRSLEIEAVDLARYKANDPANIVWRISITSPGASVSLEKAMPYFLAVLSEYIEKKAFVDIQVDNDFNIVTIKPNTHRHRPFP